MKAVIQSQIHCGECNSLMQYHEENTKVRCNQLKCEQRHVEYLAPTIELEPVEKPEKASAKNGKA